MLDFPILSVIYLIFFGLGLFLLIKLFIRLWRGNVKHREGVKTMSVTGGIIRLLFALLLIAIAAAIFWFTIALQSYRAFTKTELSAIISFDEYKQDERAFTLIISETSNGKQNKPEKYTIKGDQWAVEAHILKWDNWVNFIGIHTCYKLTRITGRYTDASDEISKERTAYDLHGGTDRLWRLLYRKGQGLPFVEAVYGSSAFNYPDEDIKFGVYVTTSGLIVKRITEKPEEQIIIL